MMSWTLYMSLPPAGSAMSLGVLRLPCPLPREGRKIGACGLALFGCGPRFPIENAKNKDTGIRVELKKKRTTEHCEKFENLSIVKTFKICLNCLEIEGVSMMWQVTSR